MRQQRDRSSWPRVAAALALAVSACGAESPQSDSSEVGFVTIAEVGAVTVSVQGDLLCWEAEIAGVVCGPGPSDEQPVTWGYGASGEDPGGERYLWGLARSDVAAFDVVVPGERLITPEIHPLEDGALGGVGVWVVVVKGPADPIAQHNTEITIDNVEMA